MIHHDTADFNDFRSIVWLQNKRDATLERSHGSNQRRDESHEYRIGRLKHERVKIPRDDSLMSWAMRVMDAHKSRKSVLEVVNIMNYGCKIRNYFI